MADPLSIAGSVAGLLGIGLKVSHALGATINGTKSAPQSVNSLSRELSALCVTLGSLERILSLNNLSKYPQFPKVDLSNVLDTMMSDFIQLQVTIRTFTDMHTDGFALKMWKRLTWVFREGAVLGLRNNLEAYKSTILMTITAVTLVTSSVTAGDMSDLPAQLKELSERIESCMKKCVELSNARTSSTRTSAGSLSHIYSVEGRESIASDISALPGSRVSVLLNANDRMSIQSARSSSTTGSGLYSYRAASIIEIYTSSIREMSSSSIIDLNVTLHEARSTPYSSALDTIAIGGRTSASAESPYHTDHTYHQLPSQPASHDHPRPPPLLRTRLPHRRPKPLLHPLTPQMSESLPRLHHGQPNRARARVGARNGFDDEVAKKLKRLAMLNYTNITDRDETLDGIKPTLRGCGSLDTLVPLDQTRSARDTLKLDLARQLDIKAEDIRNKYTGVPVFPWPPAQILFDIAIVTELKSIRHDNVLRVLRDKEKLPHIALEYLIELDEETDDKDHEIVFFRFVGCALQALIGEAKARSSNATFLEYVIEYDERQREERKSTLSDVLRRMEEGGDEIGLKSLEMLYKAQRERRECDLGHWLDVLLGDSILLNPDSTDNASESIDAILAKAS